jgi:hypothetical protein
MLKRQVRPSALRRWQKSRMFRAVMTIATMGMVITGGGLAAPAVAHASLIVPQGPAAAEDEFGNQYVFWRGATGGNNLYEAFYNVYTGKWSGATDLGMGTLGSEPTVAVTDQVFAGPGGKEFNAQYVYWEGTNGRIWMAYWHGSWSKPISLSDVTTCSAPSATTVYPNGEPEIVIFWQGIQGYCGQHSDDGGGLFYTYSTTSNPTAAGDYWPGPTWDSGADITGSAPTLTSANGGEDGGMTTVPDTVVVSWQGQDGGLWDQTWDLVSRDVSAATKYDAADVIGSVPDAAGVMIGGVSDYWNIAWTGQNDYLWLGDYDGNSFGGISSLPESGDMASAPVVVQVPNITQIGYPAYLNEHIFYVGYNDHLWQAYWVASTDTWVIQDLGDGPLL